MLLTSTVSLGDQYHYRQGLVEHLSCEQNAHKAVTGHADLTDKGVEPVDIALVRSNQNRADSLIRVL